MNRSGVAGRLCLGDVLSRFIAGVNYRDLPMLGGTEKILNLREKENIATYSNEKIQVDKNSCGK